MAKTESTAVATFDLAKYKKVADLVLQIISIKRMQVGDELYIRAESEIKQLERIDEDTGEVLRPMHTIVCTNLANGQRGGLVLPAVVHRALREAGQITGRSFGLRKGESLGTGRATLWEVWEIAEIAEAGA